MKISKSKRQLARIISENGGWCEDCDFAVQDRDSWVCSYEGRPKRFGDAWKDNGDCLYRFGFQCDTLIPSWHQTIISREEYFHLYPSPDADGWIEFYGTERPSGYFNKMIDVKLQDGRVLTDSSGRFEWDTDGASRIISYRLHKPEQSKPQSPVEMEFDIIQQGANTETKPTIEQLAADYRNAKDYADRKQQEADDAKAGAEAKLAELIAASKEL